MHRQQAHRSDAQVLQVGEGRVRGQAGVGATVGFGYAGVQLAEAAHMHFVQDAVRPGRGRRGIALPVEAVVHHTGLQRQGAVVAPIHAQRVVTGLAAVHVAPLELANHLARIGVEQQLVRVEALPLLRLPRPVGTQAVDQAGTSATEVAVPDIAAARGQDQACGLGTAAVVVQAQLDGGGMRREHGEVHTLGIDAGAQRPGLAMAQGCGAGYGAHSNITVASGGRSIRIESHLSLQATGCESARPSAVPTLLPP
jgi:hypothetical protein